MARYILIVALVVLGVAGCSGSPPSPTPSSVAASLSSASPSSASPSPRPSRSRVVPSSSAVPVVAPTVPPDVPRTGPNMRPGEKPPVMPVAATRHDPAGAKAFAEFFIRTIDWGFATLNGAYIRHYATSSCVGCLSFADGMDADKRLARRYIGGRIAVTSTRLLKYDRLDALIVVTFDQQSYEKTESSGSLVDADQAHRGVRFEVSLGWAGGWRVSVLAVIAQ